MTNVLTFIKQVRAMHAQLEKFSEVIAKMEGLLNATQATQKEIHDHLYKYEEVGLKTYCEDEKQLEKYTLFKNQQKPEVKAKHDNLPSTLSNPYKTMRLWIRWEQMDIQALLEAVELRGQIDQTRNNL